MDLADKSIVSFVIGSSNNNAFVFEIFDIARQEHPEVKPLVHSDRGYPYTSKSYRKKLEEAGMTQSMSRVSRCIDNDPMEVFWGMLKSEMYYLKKFHTYDELKEAVCDYIDYYNLLLRLHFKREQKTLYRLLFVYVLLKNRKR